MKRLLTTVALLALLVPTLGQAAIINVPVDEATIPAAVTAAVDGDQILIANGTYTLTSTLTVAKELTITGQSEAGVIVQIDTGTGWGINPRADNITLERMTLDVITSGAEAGYPIHASGTSNSSTGYFNLVIRELTVKGDQTMTPKKRRSGVDIHGYDGVTIDDVVSQDASYGNGLNLTGCLNVTVTNFTTSNNAWGSAAVYCSDVPDMGRASSNVVFDGPTLALGEDLIYQEDQFGFFSTNISVTGYEYLVFNDTFRPTATDFKFFRDTLADATSFALAFVDGSLAPVPEASSIQRISDGHWVVDAGMSIQTAVDDAMAGGTVEVLAGTFEEQVELAKDITLSGAGAAQTTIQSPSTLPLFFATSSDNYPVIYIHDTDADVQNLTVDGAGLGNANNRFIGIGFWNAGGSVSSCDVLNIIDTPFSGVQHGVGIYAYNNTGGPYSINLNDVNVLDYQKTAVALSGDGLTVDLDGVTCIGQGDTGITAQNGIQVSYGAAGSVANCVVNGNSYNGATYTASGMLLYLSGAVDVSNSNLNGNQTSIYGRDLPAMNVDDCSIDVTGAPTVSSGVLGYLSTAPKAIQRTPLEGLPLVEDYTPSAARKAAVMTVNVTNSTITGSGAADTYGIDCGSAGDPMDVTATGNTVSNWDYGVDLWGTNVTASINDNNLTGNVSAGIRSTLANSVDGTCNWYGDISGPATTTNPGSGDAVEGDVVYSPWRDGAVPGSSCNQFEGTVAANPTGEISACNSCLVVPIEFDRINTDALRGLSVTFQLSPELELCTNVGDIQEATGIGSLFGDVSGASTAFQVIDNGGGSYTADVSLLGIPCGTTTGGTAVLVGVTSAAGITTDTTGTITVTGVMARDCDNNPLPGAPGAPASVTINNGAPGTVADLNASQVKTGNDGNGTTKIDLSWTDPGDPDLATIEIYRKGFGFYPEYDDDGGSVPATPADPATAIGASWDHVASVAAGTGAYTDEPNDRDFWYYVVFANDGCNDGAVSNQTGGTLNYHLGDVAPPPNGNNLVLTGDIAALGAAYGSVDVPGDPDYNNAVDVGPTTTNFVDGRPETDNQIQFEDLLMFAINYNQVSKRPDGLASAGRSDLQLMVPSLPAVGETFEVSLAMAGDGTVHGVSTDVTWNDARVEYLGFAPGELMNRQGTYAPVFSPKVGRLDAAVFGTERGILGEGTLATLRFKVRESGDAGFEIASIDARNGDNEEASIGSSVVSGVPGAGTTAKVTQLLPNIPNPFNPATEIRFVVGQKGPVSVQIYSLQGRLVRTLVQEPMDAGEASLTWHGRDDSGRTVASGTYVVRIDGPDRTHTRNIVLLK